MKAKKSKLANKLPVSKSVSSKHPLDSIASANKGSGAYSKSGLPKNKKNN